MQVGSMAPQTGSIHGCVENSGGLNRPAGAVVEPSQDDSKGNQEYDPKEHVLCPEKGPGR